MNSRFGPRTTRDPRRQPGADREVGVPGDQRGDQREQRGQVGRQVDVAVGEHRRVRGRPHRAQRPAAALLLQPHGRDRRDLAGQRPGDRRGGVGAGVVGDRDPEAVGELRGQVGVQPPHRRLEVGLLVVDGDDDVEHDAAGGGGGLARDAGRAPRRRCSCRPGWSAVLSGRCGEPVRRLCVRPRVRHGGSGMRRHRSRAGPGEVVDGGAADGRGREVLLDPPGDPGGVVAAAGVGGRAAAAHGRSAADEVVDLAGGDEGLELRERRCRVGAVEPADGHHRLLRGELVAGGVVGADGGGDPGVGAGVLLQECRELGAGRGGAEDAARAAGAARAEPSGPTVAGRGGAPRSGGADARGGCMPPNPPAGRLAPRIPPGPPIRPAPAGPADGIAPVCGVAAVASAYAVDPPAPATSATVATATTAARGMRCTPRSPATPASPTSGTAQVSHGCQVVCASRYQAQPTVSASTTASVTRDVGAARSRHSCVTPRPTSAATAGASATV